MATTPPNDARDRLLGRAPALPLVAPGSDLGRDLALRRDADGRRRLAFVAGLDCLAQDLAIALTTALGADLFNTAFGFDGLRALAEETRPALQRERIRVAVVQVLRRDPRILRVRDVVLAGGVGDRPDPAARAARLLVVRVEAEVATGQTVKLDLTLPAT